jgi:hypothetical protein
VLDNQIVDTGAGVGAVDTEAGVADTEAEVGAEVGAVVEAVIEAGAEDWDSPMRKAPLHLLQKRLQQSAHQD